MLKLITLNNQLISNKNGAFLCYSTTNKMPNWTKNNRLSETEFEELEDKTKDYCINCDTLKQHFQTQKSA
jgi:hypothetical protein